jgi:hypothetical protein
LIRFRGALYDGATALRCSDIDEAGVVIRIDRAQWHDSHVDRAEKLRAADQVVAPAGLPYARERQHRGNRAPKWGKRRGLN